MADDSASITPISTKRTPAELADLLDAYATVYRNTHGDGDGTAADLFAIAKALHDALAEIERLRGVIASHHALARSSVGPAATERAKAIQEAVDHCNRLAERYEVDAEQEADREDRRVAFASARAARVAGQIVATLANKEG